MTTNTPTERLEELAEAYRAWKNEEVDSGIYVLEAVGPALEAYATLLAELAQARAEVERLEGVIEKMKADEDLR